MDPLVRETIRQIYQLVDSVKCYPFENKETGMIEPVISVRVQNWLSRLNICKLVNKAGEHHWIANLAVEPKEYYSMGKQRYLAERVRYNLAYCCFVILDYVAYATPIFLQRLETLHVPLKEIGLLLEQHKRFENNMPKLELPKLQI